MGLVAAGVGTFAFLRNTLIVNLDAQLVSLAPTDVASGLIDVTTDEGMVSFNEKPDAPDTQYFVAIYDSTGQLRAQAGGDGEAAPLFPAVFSLERTALGTTPFSIPSQIQGEVFHASVDVYPIDGVGELFTQMVTLPIAPINTVVASFVGIYGILALLILIAGAFATRFLVTLAFRSLGQVEATAISISHGDFGQRLTDIEPRTEVGRLKTALNTMLGRIDGALAQRDSTVRQMRRFIGDASHELRTPLVTVRGYAELYRMGAIRGDDDIAQAMDRIEKEAIRMGLLVEDLLALARLDERRDVVMGPVDLRPVARDAALDVRAASPLRPITVVDTTTDPLAGDPSPSGPDERAPEAPVPEDPEIEAARRKAGPPTSAIARASGATLSLLRRRSRAGYGATETGAIDLSQVPPAPETPVAASVPPIVLGDENRIRQVVTNLLGNARRFTADDSPIELRVGVDVTTGAGWIEVVDHGEGIPDQIKDMIFQRFWRADTSRTRETGGSGLGLSIVASIVDALHGHVEVRDTPGGGATFRVLLPLDLAREAAEHLLIETQPLPRLSLG